MQDNTRTNQHHKTTQYNTKRGKPRQDKTMIKQHNNKTTQYNTRQGNTIPKQEY